MDKISWPSQYRWLHEYALAKPDAVLEYKETWDALLYRVYGKIFALLLQNRTSTLLNLKCDPYLSLDYRARYPHVLPGWHMNKLHWISLDLAGSTPESICKELVDISYGLVWNGLPKRVRERASSECGCDACPPWHVYLLECADGTLYCGVAKDVCKRLGQHNGEFPGGARYTSGRRPVRLLGSKECETQGEALRLERRVKRLPRREKLSSILGVHSI